MKTEVYVLNNNDVWTESIHGTKKEILEQYPNAVLVMTSKHYYYYSADDRGLLLYRIIRPLRLTKKEAEDKYNIEIKCW